MQKQHIYQPQDPKVFGFTQKEHRGDPLALEVSHETYHTQSKRGLWHLEVEHTLGHRRLVDQGLATDLSTEIEDPQASKVSASHRQSLAPAAPASQSCFGISPYHCLTARCTSKHLDLRLPFRDDRSPTMPRCTTLAVPAQPGLGTTQPCAPRLGHTLGLWGLLAGPLGNTLPLTLFTLLSGSPSLSLALSEVERVRRTRAPQCHNRLALHSHWSSQARMPVTPEEPFAWLTPKRGFHFRRPSPFFSELPSAVPIRSFSPSARLPGWS